MPGVYMTEAENDIGATLAKLTRLFHPAPPPGELEEPAASAADVSSQQPEAPGWFLFA